MKIKKFNGFTKSEMKKIESYANKKNHVSNCTITGYGYYESNDQFQVVTCEICKGIDGERVDDVEFTVCLFDRRRSFINDTDLLEKKMNRQAEKRRRSA